MTTTELPAATPAQAKAGVPFGPEVFAMDYAAEATRLDKRLRESLRQTHKRGLVLGVSGGIDSSVSLALAVRAVGPERVFALLMPERDSSDDSERRGRMLCEKLGVPFALENIAEALEGAGCYRRRDEAISRLIPDYVPGWRHKIVVNAPGETTFAYFKLVVEKPGGEQVSVRMPNDVYLQVVAATNFKQRIRKNLDYYHADRLNFAVIGTPNKLEYDLGFFVRGGDGLADVKPIAHLYKTQVFAMARHLGLPEEICNQTPSTDTYSLPQTQEEFYFALPYHKADLVLYGMEHGSAAADVAGAVGLTEEQVKHVVRDFERKQAISARLMAPSILLGETAGTP
jgi:NAD+ synthase